MPRDVATTISMNQLGTDLSRIDEKVVQRCPRPKREHRLVFEQQEMIVR